MRVWKGNGGGWVGGVGKEEEQRSGAGGRGAGGVDKDANGARRAGWWRGEEGKRDEVA